MARRKNPNAITVYRVVTISDDCVVDTAEFTNDADAIAYAANEHSDYGYTLSAFCGDFWREVAFCPAEA